MHRRIEPAVRPIDHHAHRLVVVVVDDADDDSDVGAPLSSSIRHLPHRLPSVRASVVDVVDVDVDDADDMSSS